MSRETIVVSNDCEHKIIVFNIFLKCTVSRTSSKVLKIDYNCGYSQTERRMPVNYVFASVCMLCRFIQMTILHVNRGIRKAFYTNMLNKKKKNYVLTTETEVDRKVP